MVWHVNLTRGFGTLTFPAIGIEAAIFFGFQMRLCRVHLLLGGIEAFPSVSQHYADRPADEKMEIRTIS